MRWGTRTIAIAAFAFLLVPALSANDNDTPAAKAADESAISTPAPEAAVEPASAGKTPWLVRLLPPVNASPDPPAPRMHSDSDYPKVDLFFGYTYLRGVPRTVTNRIVELNGGSVDLAYNFNRWFGLAGDFGGFADSRLILNYPGTLSREVPSEGKVFTYLIGPRFSYRGYKRITPFAQVLVGAAQATEVTIDGCTGVPGCTALQDNTAFALTAGAGLDLNVSRHFALRLLQAEYMVTFFDDASFPQGVDGYQNDVRLSAGIVFRFGGSHPAPPPVNHPPVASCSAGNSMVYVGSGDMVPVTATASDPDNDTLNYTWSASGGRVDGSGPQVRWLSADTAVGAYTVTLNVDDGHGGTAMCSAEIRVEARPNHPPTITCSPNPSSVFAGERSHITCNASDPDGDPLTYTWHANSGRITGNGPAGDFDTTGLSPGPYSITTRVEDGRGGAADASVVVTVKAVPPAPMAEKINECAFGTPLSTRIDNVCKRILDDVALRLQNEPRATAVIIGYSDPKERRPDQIAGDRGTNAVKYLGEKGIDASRVTTRTGTGQAGATNNRRIDIIWVPEGATY